MELTGKIILDSRTMEVLKGEIREEVIKDISENGNYSEEILRYLDGTNCENYIRILESSIDSAIERAKNEDLHWESQKKAFKKMQIIQQILTLS